MSKNAQGWIRHRGGKCPVEIGAIVDIRNRDGRVFEGVLASNENCWVHRESPSLSDVMAYRLHKPAEQDVIDELDGAISIATDGPASAMAKVIHARAIACGLIEPAEQVDDNADLKAAAYDAIQPLQWRDRIIEIDATTQALTTERADLVQKLASEGFALIERVVEPVEDMSDPKNWREGDCFVQTAEDVHGAKKGELWVMSQDDGTTAKAYVRENGDEWYVANSHLKFHSRPSA